MVPVQYQKAGGYDGMKLYLDRDLQVLSLKHDDWDR
jgi:hypothetical protein